MLLDTKTSFQCGMTIGLIFGFIVGVIVCMLFT